jgi:hypothetical protein
MTEHKKFSPSLRVAIAFREACQFGRRAAEHIGEHSNERDGWIGAEPCLKVRDVTGARTTPGAAALTDLGLRKAGALTETP